METEQIILRIILIIILSFFLWLEREFKNQPAWTRTHILIWLWSTIFMIISIMMPQLYVSNMWDPSRIAAQVVSGIWFLWAWAIIKIWMNTRGLTTAANIWATSAIWLAVWAWMYTLAIFATIIILFNLIIVNYIKNKLIKKDSYYHITIEMPKNSFVRGKIIDKIKSLPIKIYGKNIIEKNKFITLKIACRGKKADISDIYKQVKDTKHVEKISISENMKY